MITIRAAALAAAFSFAAILPAPAMNAADFATGRAFVSAPVDLGLGDELLSGRPARVERIGADAAQRAAQRYFDFDAFVTLGALAVALGALAGMTAFARRHEENEVDVESEEPGWRKSVFAAIQADLAQFTNTYRRAA